MSKSKLVFGMSLSKTKPGKNKSKIEFIDNNDIIELSKLYDLSPEWRQTLSSLYPCILNIDNLTFNSVEHYIQYRKIKLADEKIALIFTRESGSKIGLGDGYTARKYRKIIMLTKEQLNQWESIIDEVKTIARNEKFSKGLPNKILLATSNAELWSVAPRCKPIRMVNHELLREKLKNKLLDNISTNFC